MDNVQLVSLANIRVSEKQKRKVSRDKVQRHLLELEKNAADVYPIEVHELSDGTYTIAGNGRHRYFAYVLAGYSHIPAVVRNITDQSAALPGGNFLIQCGANIRH